MCCFLKVFSENTRCVFFERQIVSEEVLKISKVFVPHLLWASARFWWFRRLLLCFLLAGAVSSCVVGVSQPWLCFVTTSLRCAPSGRPSLGCALLWRRCRVARRLGFTALAVLSLLGRRQVSAVDFRVLAFASLFVLSLLMSRRLGSIALLVLFGF